MIAPTERIETGLETFHGLIEGHSAKRPDAIALRTRERELSYGELNSLANALACEIHEVVVQRSFIAAFLDDGLESAAALLQACHPTIRRAPPG